MTDIRSPGMKIIFLFLLLAAVALISCEGSDTRENVDNTVEELAGKKKVDQMKDMQKSVGNIQNQQTERLKQLDDMDE